MNPRRVTRTATCLLLLLGGLPLLAQTKPAAVMGVVLEADGKPAAHLRVILSVPLVGPSGSLPAGPSATNLFSGAYALPVRGTDTDADGAFYLSNVPAGRYILAAAGPSAWTYFPNSPDRSKATPVTLRSAQTTNVGSFTLLAPGTGGASVPPDRPAWDGLKKVPVRINVEGLSRSPDPFELFFASLNNQAITVRFEPRAGKLPPPSLEFNRRSLYISMPVPENFSGVFEVPLWDGEFSVLPTGHPVKNGFYIKGLSIGNTDLMRQRLKVPDSLKDTLMVTLAHCTDTTPECN